MERFTRGSFPTREIEGPEIIRRVNPWKLLLGRIGLFMAFTAAKHSSKRLHNYGKSPFLSIPDAPCMEYLPTFAP